MLDKIKMKETANLKIFLSIIWWIDVLQPTGHTGWETLLLTKIFQALSPCWIHLLRIVTVCPCLRHQDMVMKSRVSYHHDQSLNKIQKYSISKVKILLPMRYFNLWENHNVSKIFLYLFNSSFENHGYHKIREKYQNRTVCFHSMIR